MNINMKKTAYILFAAAFAMASASCAREEIFDNVRTGEVRTFTCSLGEDQTRTDITTKGKTVWSENDSLLVSNGTDADTVVVDRKYAGEKYFSFETSLTGKICVVYPHNAAKSVEEGKFTLEIPGVQDGTFGSANIACAIADENNTVRMKNVTSVVKFRVPQSTVKPINTVSISSLKDSLAGIFTVDLTSGSPVVTNRDVASSASGVNLNLAGKFGNFYATVIPGSYDAGFSLTAVALDLEHAYESLSTKSATELKANDLYDLGRIGENLKPISGKGTQADPYQISNLAELTALANVVNNGNSMEGKYIKVMNDIKGVNTTIGYFDDAQPKDKDVYFKGDFDGNGKTITLNLKQTAKKSLALIGDAAYPANIHDVIVDGTVNSTYNYVAGVCAKINGGQGSKVSNCTNKATVNGASYVGGVVGYCDGKTANGVVVSGGKNYAEITGTDHSIGGVVGGALDNSSVVNCSNDGAIVGKHRVGGVLGRMDLEVANTANIQLISRCVNNGVVSGSYEVGGITGSFDHNKKGGNDYSRKRVLNCTNNGDVLSNGGGNNGNTGGIIGGVSYAVFVSKCVNNGKVTVTGGHKTTGGITAWSQNVYIINSFNKGEISGYSQVGGLTGYSYYSWIYNSANEAPVTAGWYLGGLVGYCRQDYITNSYNTGYVFGKNQSGVYAGGLVGYIWATSKYKTYLWNCYNTAAVEYNYTTASTDPIVGGIVGGFFNKQGNFGNIENVVNSGRIGPKDADDVTTESFSSGTIGGIIYNTGIQRCCFGLENTSSRLYGKKVGGTSVASTKFFDNDGTLKGTVSLGTEKFSNAVDALNADIRIYNGGNPTWLKWRQGTNGPELVFAEAEHPLSAADSGLDIGNGGNI